MELYFWGANSHFQSGTGVEEEQFETPIPVGFPETDKIAEIKGGGGHTIIVTKEGKAFSAGWNNKGQAGVPKIDPVKKFSQIFDNIRTARCGWDVSCLISTSDDVYMFGNNQHEQFGTQTPKEIDHPLKVKYPGSVSDVQFGLRHTAVLTSTSQVFIFGKSKCCKMAEMMPNSRKFVHNEVFYLEILFESPVSQISSGQHFTLAYTDDHRIFLIGENKHASLVNQEINISTIPKGIQEIATGWTHALILDKNGVCYTFGRNNYHQLGRKTEDFGPLELPEKVKKIFCGSEHSAILTESNNILTFGWNEHGNCGLNGTENVEKPSEVPLKGKCLIFGTGCGFCFALIQR